MFFHTGLAVLVIVVGADGSVEVETDPELALARAVFAREFPDDAHDLRFPMIVEVVES